jgi:hypothetical protein
MSKLTEPQKKWVNALRSGKYEQYKGALTKDGKYCCLGVACEISSIELDPGWKIAETLAYEGKPVREELGLKNSTGTFDGVEFDLGGCTYNDLASLNDAGLTFNQIADFIESNPERIFKK